MSEERQYQTLLKKMEAFRVPDKVTDEQAGNKWLRRYHNVMMDAATYIRNKNPQYKSLLRKAEAIERKWDMEGKYTRGSKEEADASKRSR